MEKRFVKKCSKFDIDPSELKRQDTPGFISGGPSKNQSGEDVKEEFSPGKPIHHETFQVDAKKKRAVFNAQFRGTFGDIHYKPAADMEDLRKKFLTEKEIVGNKDIIYTFLSGEDSEQEAAMA